MAKGEAKKTNQMIAAEQGRSQAQQGQFYSTLQGQYAPAQQRAGQAYGDIYSGLGDIAKTGGYDADTIARIRGATQTGDFATARERLGALGGATIARDPNLQKLSEEGGGWDPTSLSTVRGGYKNLADTGGYTAGDISRVRRQAADIPSAMYDAMGRSLGNQSRIQGVGPGYTAQNRALLRDKAIAGDEALRKAEIGLQQDIRTGKLAGLGGLGTTEGSIAGTRLGAAGALQSAAGQEAALRSNERLAAAEGFGKLGQIGLGTEFDLANAITGNKLSALGGMSNLYGMTPGELEALNRNMLASQGLQSGTQGNLLQARIANNPNISPWDRVSQVMGGAGGLLTGLSGFKLPFSGGNPGGGGGGGGGGNPIGSGGDYGINLGNYSFNSGGLKPGVSTSWNWQNPWDVNPYLPPSGGGLSNWSPREGGWF